MPVINNSMYIVNNSLHCNIQPKRTSFDANTYMQLHRKITRKALIERKFEEGLTELDKREIERKGFKGSLLPENMFFTQKSRSTKEKKYFSSEDKLSKTFHPDNNTNEVRYI